MENFTYTEKGEDNFRITISKDMEKKIKSMAASLSKKPFRVETDEGECIVYNSYMMWLLAGDNLPPMGLPTFDRSKAFKAYFEGFQQGLSEFQSRWGNRYTPSNEGSIIALKNLYEYGLNGISLKHYRNAIPPTYNKAGFESTGRGCGMFCGLDILAKDYPEDFKDIFEPVNHEKIWTKLHKGLINKYIKDVSLNDFNEVMNYKRLPNGKDKIKWYGKKTEAMFFQQKYKFSPKELNQCFVHKDGSIFEEHNRGNSYPKPVFIAILENS